MMNRTALGLLLSLSFSFAGALGAPLAVLSQTSEPESAVRANEQVATKEAVSQPTTAAPIDAQSTGAPATIEKSTVVEGKALSGIEWTDVETGLRLAREKGKPIIADIYTDWCGYCKKLDKVTFKDPAVAAFVNSTFIPIKVNAEDKAAGQKLATEYSITAFPTVLVFSADGSLKGKVEGFFKPETFQQKIKQILAK